ncbi:response regulator transcription factor [Metabacillus fastidiosus]|nr:response regulator transcription factor [Metabacillus fastidiosus]MEC2075058.1 response regulator transcription factor [Metabacillus fastidiosus]
MKRRILIIEDEIDIARIVKDYLNINGYETAIAENGRDAWHLIHTLNPEFIILDLTLPDIDGIELCRQIRGEVDTPILILSARGSDTDKVLGLGYGADDYMTKPFSFTELVARINAHLRRFKSLEKKKEKDSILQFGTTVIDKSAYKVTVDSKAVSLSAKEFELLYFLAEHKNQVFTKTQLLDAVWGYTNYGDENTITVYVRRIREKFEIDPSDPKYLKTVWGVGYKFSFDE